MRIYGSVEELIGNTPLLRLSKIESLYNLKSTLLAKVEASNPAGSVKDRVAKEMLDDAQRRGLLAPGATVIEPTSGNTGIGLCALAAARGYAAIIVMPDTMSAERRMLMAAYGAKVVLSDGALGMAGAIAKAKELAQSIPGAFLPGQFDNPANAQAHYKTTGPEILRDTEGQVDILVAGIGTGGTITGTGRYLKEHCPGVQVVGVEPDTSAVLSGEKPGKHGLQGIGAGFVPTVLDTAVLDEVMRVSDGEAYETARRFAKAEGLLIGISAGAALSAAITLAARPENEGKTIVTILPDSGERYLSTELYRAQMP